MRISSRNTLTNTPRILLDQVSGGRWPTKLPPKTSHRAHITLTSIFASPSPLVFQHPDPCACLSEGHCDGLQGPSGNPGSPPTSTSLTESHGHRLFPDKAAKFQGLSLTCSGPLLSFLQGTTGPIPQPGGCGSKWALVQARKGSLASRESHPLQIRPGRQDAPFPLCNKCTPASVYGEAEGKHWPLHACTSKRPPGLRGGAVHDPGR